MTMIKKENLIKRTIILLFGVFLVATGVAFSIHANLGTSPVTSLPYTLSCCFGWTSGKWSVVVHSVFIIFQILLLRKNYKPINLLQLPLGIFFGTFVDIMNNALNFLKIETYPQQLFYCFIGIVLVAWGVAFEVEADIMVLAIEGFAVTASEVFKKKFGDVKMFTDCGIVVAAVIFGLIFLKKVVGVREGTAAAAILVGQMSKIFKKLFFGHKKA